MSLINTINLSEIKSKRIIEPSDLSERELKEIYKRFKIPETDQILGLLDDSIKNTKSEGLVFSSEGIYWRLDKAFIDEERHKTGILEKSCLENYFVDIEEKLINKKFSFVNKDAASKLYNNIDLYFTYLDIQELTAVMNQLDFNIDDEEKADLLHGRRDQDFLIESQKNTIFHKILSLAAVCLLIGGAAILIKYM